MAQGAVSERVVARTADAVRARSLDEVEQLLTAAEVVLERTGYDGFRIDDVLTEAGLSTRACYRHFRSKNELFLALFDREMLRADARLRAKLAAEATPEAKVRTWIRATLALGFDPRLARRTRLFLLERHILAAEFRADVDRCVRLQLAPLEEAIAEGRDRGVFPGARPAFDALAVYHLCVGLTTDRVLGIGALARAEAVALAERVAFSTLGMGRAAGHPVEAGR
jgi:AcrR family transcriptional regulator